MVTGFFILSGLLAVLLAVGIWKLGRIKHEMCRAIQ